MRFRILDLILATAFLAGLLSAFSADLIFFRQMLFLACTTVCATIGCLFFPKKRSPIRVGAVAGAVGGLAFTTITLLSPFHFYVVDQEYLLMNSPPIRYFPEAAIELILAPFFAMFLGAAIGPLFAFHLTSKPTPSNRLPHMLSWCFLGATVLLAFFSMRERLEFGVPTRKWIYLVPLVLTFFVFHTTQWIQREHDISAPDSKSA